MASDGLPDREQPGPSGAPSGPLPGTFLGPVLDVRSEYLYELGPDIPDVMGLRVFRPDAAAVKVMSVRDNPGRPCDVWLPRDTATRYGRRGVAVHVTVSWTISVVPGRGLYLHL